METLTVRIPETYKTRTVYLSYLTIALERKRCPTLDEIKNVMYRHFVQEFGTYGNEEGRWQTYGAIDEDHFVRMLESGACDVYQPTIKEMMDVLVLLDLTFYDYENKLINSPVQEVW